MRKEPFKLNFRCPKLFFHDLNSVRPWGEILRALRKSWGEISPKSTFNLPTSTQATKSLFALLESSGEIQNNLFLADDQCRSPCAVCQGCPDLHHRVDPTSLDPHRGQQTQDSAGKGVSKNPNCSQLPSQPLVSITPGVLYTTTRVQSTELHSWKAFFFSLI